MTEPLKRRGGDPWDSSRDFTRESFRARFPSLASMAYFASCSHGLLSTDLAAALDDFRDAMVTLGNPWGLWETRAALAREMFAAKVGAAPDEIAIVSCASEGAYQVASGQSWAERPGLVTCDLEFPSLASVWHGQRPRGAEVRFAALDAEGFADVDGYRSAIGGDDTSLVSVPLVSYRNGQRLPVEAITEAAAAAGARVIVDAYQGLGVEPVRVDDLGCDYLVSGTLKYLLGVPGIAFLYVRRGTEHPVGPQLTGWFGQADPFGFDPRSPKLATTASRFEVGSPPILAAYGAIAGLQVLADLPAADVHDGVAELTAETDARLRRRGERVISPQDSARRGPMVAFTDEDSLALTAAFRERDVVVSPRGTAIRLAFHHYTTPKDLDRLFDALQDIRGR